MRADHTHGKWAILALCPSGWLQFYMAANLDDAEEDAAAVRATGRASAICYGDDHPAVKKGTIAAGTALRTARDHAECGVHEWPIRERGCILRVARVSEICSCHDDVDVEWMADGTRASVYRGQVIADAASPSPKGEP